MHNVTPEVFLIGKPAIAEEQMRQWLELMKAPEYHTGRNVQLNAAEELVELAGRRCYMSFKAGLNPNVTKIREDSALYLEHILDSGHGSVLEHCTFTFALENVSRVFTAEMNRHRAGMAISEGSMRYIRFTDIPFWMPNSIQDQPEDSEEVLEKKRATRRIFNSVFQYAEDSYRALVELWDMDHLPDFSTKKQLTSCLRRIIPIGVASGGIWSGNIRALRHIFTMRCAASAEEEICLVATKMLKLMMTECPNIFGDFKCDDEGFWGPIYKKV